MLEFSTDWNSAFSYKSTWFFHKLSGSSQQ